MVEEKKRELRLYQLKEVGKEEEIQTDSTEVEARREHRN